jgi:hypothetical protein
MISVGREFEEQLNAIHARHVYCTNLIYYSLSNVAVDNYAEDTTVGCLREACDLLHTSIHQLCQMKT